MRRWVTLVVNPPNSGKDSLWCSPWLPRSAGWDTSSLSDCLTAFAGYVSTARLFYTQAFFWPAHSWDPFSQVNRFPRPKTDLNAVFLSVIFLQLTAGSGLKKCNPIHYLKSVVKFSGIAKKNTPSPPLLFANPDISPD